MSTWAPTAVDQQAFAAFVNQCAECGAEVAAILVSQGEETKLSPCGHKASIRLVPNPRLRVPPATPERA